METTNFQIEGMRCEACAERITRLLERQHGVSEAHVPFAGGGEARVRFNPHVIRRDDLVSVVREAGYDVADLD
jgi:Cu+-exporting ATPase